MSKLIMGYALIVVYENGNEITFEVDDKKQAQDVIHAVYNNTNANGFYSLDTVYGTALFTSKALRCIYLAPIAEDDEIYSNN